MYWNYCAATDITLRRSLYLDVPKESSLSCDSRLHLEVLFDDAKIVTIVPLVNNGSFWKTSETIEMSVVFWTPGAAKLITQTQTQLSRSIDVSSCQLLIIRKDSDQESTHLGCVGLEGDRLLALSLDGKHGKSHCIDKWLIIRWSLRVLYRSNRKTWRSLGWCRFGDGIPFWCCSSRALWRGRYERTPFQRYVCCTTLTVDEYSPT